MHWFFVALIPPFLWAITNHLDKYLLNKYAKQIKLASFIIFAGFFVLPLAIFILIFKPHVVHIPVQYALMMMTAGIFFTIYLFPYYRALIIEDTSIVVPMFQMVPILGFILAFIFLREHLEAKQILAGIIIILGSIGLSLELSEKIRLKSQVFFLMFIASLLVSIGVLTYKFVAIKTDYWTAIFWEEIGMIVAVIFLFFIKDNRKNFIESVLTQNRNFMIVMTFNEILNRGAGLIVSYAFLLVPIALVQLVSSVQPLFVFIMGIIMAVFLPKFSLENMTRKFLVQKIVFICLILLGSYLLFGS